MTKREDLDECITAMILIFQRGKKHCKGNERGGSFVSACIYYASLRLREMTKSCRMLFEVPRGIYCRENPPAFHTIQLFPTYQVRHLEKRQEAGYFFSLLCCLSFSSISFFTSSQDRKVIVPFSYSSIRSLNIFLLQIQELH